MSRVQAHLCLAPDVAAPRRLNAQDISTIAWAFAASREAAPQARVRVWVGVWVRATLTLSLTLTLTLTLTLSSTPTLTLILTRCGWR